MEQDRGKREQPKLQEKRVFTKEEFLVDFRYEAAGMRKGGAIATMVMALVPGRTTDAVLSAYEAVPEDIRPTVDMRLIFDDYSLLTQGPRIARIDDNLPWMKKSHRAANLEMSRIIKRASNIGAKIKVLNPAASIFQEILPATGRSHLKGSYVRNGLDSVFYIQTGNFEDAKRTEFFVKYTGETAIKFIDLFDRLTSEKPKEDFSVELGPGIEMYYDAGIPGQSIILDKAKELVNGAKDSIFNISLFHPDGIEQELIAAAKRDINTCVLSTKFHFDFKNIISFENVLTILDRIGRVKSRLKKIPYTELLDQEKWAHAKVLIVDDYLYIGSHNLSLHGVRAGTQEWQFLIRDTEVVREMKDLLEYSLTSLGIKPP